MTTRLVILGLLRDRPLYGYELKHIIEEHMGDWTAIAFGSIYYALDKLAGEGFVEQVGVEQEGARPARTVYQITETGRAEFLRLLREVWSAFERQYFAIDVGLAFMNALPAEEIKQYLHRRVTMLEEVLQHIQEHQAEQIANPDVPAQARAVFEHSRLHMEAELAWTRDVLQQVEQGVYV
ncbi:MAG TPA: PadR family transcriptional regulator [Anaerolineae bacterium]|nr:PadR family transcriptional regulator [Anaerolineae bacterium]